MSLRIIKNNDDSGTYFYGVGQEAGIQTRRFQVKYFPEVNERWKNASGETFLRSVSQKFSREVLVEGEFQKAGIGVMLYTVGVAMIFANGVNQFITTPPTTGTVLLDDASTSADRHGWFSVSIRGSSNPLL